MLFVLPRFIYIESVYLAVKLCLTLMKTKLAFHKLIRQTVASGQTNPKRVLASPDVKVANNIHEPEKLRVLLSCKVLHFIFRFIFRFIFYF